MRQKPPSVKKPGRPVTRRPGASPSHPAVEADREVLARGPVGCEGRRLAARERTLAFSDIQNEIVALLQQMTNQPEDVHELAQQIRDKLNMLRAEGLPIPEDLVELEERLEQEYGA
jgi:hypothetical protein